MVALKLKILWLFLTVFQTGCVAKSEEYDFETDVKNLDLKRDFHISRANHSISDEFTTVKVSSVANSTKENTLNNIFTTHYEKSRRYNPLFINASTHFNNSNEKEDVSGLNFHIDSINEDFDKARYERNYVHNVKNVDGTSKNFKKLDAYNTSRNSGITPPINKDFEFALNRYPKFGLYTNSPIAVPNNAESTTRFLKDVKIIDNSKYYEGFFEPSLRLGNKTEQNKDIMGTTEYSRDIDSQDIFNASIDVAGGRVNGFKDKFKPSNLSANSNDNKEQSLSVETLDIDSKEIFNTTVEDIFSNADSDFKYPEPTINSTGPKNDIIDRWLTAEKKGLTLHNYKSHNNSLSRKPLQSYIDFDANHVRYNYSNKTVDEKEINRSETKSDNKPLSEKSTTGQQILLQEDYLIGTINPNAQWVETDGADDIQVQHSSPSQEQETISANTDITIPSILLHFNHTDEFSPINNFKDIPFINNTTSKMEDNKLTSEPSFLQNYKIFSENLQNSLNRTDFDNKVVYYTSNNPIQISENEFITTLPELVFTTQNVSSTSDEDTLWLNISNVYENSQKKLINKNNEKSETFINNNIMKLQEKGNTSFLQPMDLHNSTYGLILTQTKINNQNVSELNFDSKRSNVSLSVLKLNEQSMLKDIGKTLMNSGSTESQISKPIIATILTNEMEISNQTNNFNSSAAPIPLMFSNTSLDENFFNEQLPKTNKSPLDYDNDKISSSYVSFYTNKIKLTTSPNGIEEQGSAEQFPDSDMNLVENKKNVNIATESRMAFVEDDNETNNFSINRLVTKKTIEDFSDLSYFYGRVNADDGTVRASLNLTIKIFVNNTRIHLPPNISVEENYGLENTSILLKWEAAENLYNISTLFHVRYENGYCLLDDIHLTLTKRRNSEIFQDTVIGESLTVQGKHLKLFKTEFGTIYHRNAETMLSMKHGFKIYLANVQFFVRKDLNLSKRKGDPSPTLLADYYKELIGGSVGILLIGGVALYTFTKLRKTKDSFIPTVG